MQEVTTLYETEKRQVIVPGEYEKTITFAARQWMHLALHAICSQGYFHVALSGGSTPKAIFEKLRKYRKMIDWSCVKLFWSDERNVPYSHRESNYQMAMEAAFSHLPLRQENIFPMLGEKEKPAETAEEAAALGREYEKTLLRELPEKQFDLVMLGMGEDGHTASLFPHTEAAQQEEISQLVVGHYVPEKKSYRVTLTWRGIHSTRKLVIYALGEKKAAMVKEITDPLSQKYPIQKIGWEDCIASFIIDQDAARGVQSGSKSI